MGDSITIYPPDSLWMIGNTLHWSNVECEYLVGYKVYRGRNSNEYGFPYFVKDSFITFDNLIENQNYFFRVSSIDTLENESLKSYELAVIFQEPLKKKIGVILSWLPNTESDLAGYKVYKGDKSKNYISIIDVGNVISWKDSIFCETSYYYAVTAYDTASNESGYSNEVIANFTCSETLIDVGDFNGDGEIGFLDIVEFAPFFAVTVASSKFDIKYDLDNDGEIGFFDLLILARNFGRKL
ncbi:MAG: dockerin type I domain-containing protein [Candidatus Hodarchaeota archaeon]